MSDLPASGSADTTGADTTGAGAAEDGILLRLARSAAARSGGVGAAVRDGTGRTYAAGPVQLPSLRLSALEAAVAQAVASAAGAVTLETVALAGEADAGADPRLLADVGQPRVLRAGA